MLEKIIDTLDERIKKSISNSNIEIIFNDLDKIKDSTLICGVGGSRVVATFLEKVLVSKNKIIARNIDAEEYFLSDFKNYSNLFLISHSGKNHGIKSLINVDKNKYLLSTRKSKISNEILLNYKVEDRTKSFISFDDTFIPLSIILSYYLNSYEFNIKMPKTEEFNIEDFKDVNIIYDNSSKTCAIFLETCFVEAGIASVTMHTKYSFCHGRSNLISNKDSLVIYLITRKSDLDELLISEIPKICSNILVLEEINEDIIVADYLLTLKALNFINYLSKNFNKEFVNVKYNKIIPTIYHFKGDLV